MLAVNKADLEESWDIDATDLAKLGFPVVKTSAKTGAEVESTFASLARAMMG
jgi:Fe2+ transport system protein B